MPTAPASTPRTMNRRHIAVLPPPPGRSTRNRYAACPCARVRPISLFKYVKRGQSQRSHVPMPPQVADSRLSKSLAAALKLPLFGSVVPSHIRLLDGVGALS